MMVEQGGYGDEDRRCGYAVAEKVESCLLIEDAVVVLVDEGGSSMVVRE